MFGAVGAARGLTVSVGKRSAAHAAWMSRCAWPGGRNERAFAAGTGGGAGVAASDLDDVTIQLCVAVTFFVDLRRDVPLNRTLCFGNVHISLGGIKGVL